MKRLGFLSVIMLVLCVSSQLAYALPVNNIPQTTLQIAKSTQGIKDIFSSGSKIVRVGIGSQNFSSYVWSSKYIYGR